MKTLTFGKFWCHIPQIWHVGSMDKVWASFQEAEPSDEAVVIPSRCEPLPTLYDIAAKRRIAMEEPFKGNWLGSWRLVFPTLEFYMHPR